MAAPVQAFGMSVANPEVVVAADEDRYKELRSAAANGEVGRVTELLRDVCFSQDQLKKAFAQAVSKGHEEAAAIFIQSNVFSEEGFEKALQIAALKGNKHLVILLLESGAGDDGKALLFAVKKSRAEIVQALLEARIDTYKANGAAATALEFAITKHDEAIASALLEADVDPNSLDDHKTPLFINALRFGDFGIVDAFLRSGVNVDLAGTDGKTALHCVISIESSEMVRKLFDAGAAVNVRDEQGNTPFDLLCMSPNDEQFRELAPLFLENGADASSVVASYRLERTPLN